MTEATIAQGFDRGVDYSTIKAKFIGNYLSLVEFLETELRPFERRMAINKIIYLHISMIQLGNGARAEESCEAFLLFLKDNFTLKNDAKVVVQVAKSESEKTGKDGAKYTTKARYRHIKYPKWVEIKYVDEMTKALTKLPNLKKCHLNYLLRNCDTNSHSLRYAFVSHALIDLKMPMNIVAKHIGHVDVGQIVRYTQKKEADKLFDLI